MKINILDAGLYEKAGHHFDHNRNLAAYLSAEGHEVTTYGAATMRTETIEALEPFGPVSKLFRAPHYGHPARFDYFAGELYMFDQQVSLTVEDLRSVGQADAWLWPSMRANQLYACARAGAKVPVVGCIHEDPGVEERSIAAKLWRLSFLTAQREGLPYRIGSVEPELRHRFMEILADKRFAIFPHPYNVTPISKPKDRLAKIGFFGHHRSDKGIRLLGALAMRLAQDGYRVVFQDSSDLRRNLPHENIELLDFVDDMSAPIAECDLVVLPYDVEGYTNKGSGILAICMMLGVPVIGPVGTIPGRTIERFRVGPLFPKTQADAIYATIKVVEAHFMRFATQAFEVSRSFAQRNGVENYVKTVMQSVRDMEATAPISGR